MTGAERYRTLREALKAAGSPADANQLSGFFKTGPGEYGEGDRFRGIRVPVLRKMARAHVDLPHSFVIKLLKSAWHEDRLTALLIMLGQYRRGDKRQRQNIYDSYLRHTRYINNWDLVDITAPHVVGRHLEERSRKVLYQIRAGVL